MTDNAKEILDKVWDFNIEIIQEINKSAKTEEEAKDLLFVYFQCMCSVLCIQSKLDIEHAEGFSESEEQKILEKRKALLAILTEDSVLSGK